MAGRYPPRPHRAAGRPAHGLETPHLQLEGLAPLCQGNAEGLLQTNAVRACAASRSPRRLRAPTRPSRARRLRRSVAPGSRAAGLSAERNLEPNCPAPCARVRGRARRAGGRSGSRRRRRGPGDRTSVPEGARSRENARRLLVTVAMGGAAGPERTWDAPGGCCSLACFRQMPRRSSREFRLRRTKIQECDP